jgi:phosphohistidine swiveling domain-containing protein/uncharacterized protein YukE
MSKLSQLEELRDLGLPTPAFRAIDHASFLKGEAEKRADGLHFPLAVRSTYSEEDGGSQSFAGLFHTALQVGPEKLTEAVEAVFASYPQAENQQVILQEMIAPTYSGVLFAFRDHVWKLEWVEGLGEQLVSGQVQPEQILLPPFTQADLFWQKLYPNWKVKTGPKLPKSLLRPFMELSVATQQLLAHFAEEAPHGLDIEFCLDARYQLKILQARPITTPEEAEEVLTSANHKEILPPYPSPFMTGLIRDCSQELFAYYKRMDPQLPDRDFIEVSGGMPWINLSALLEVMIQWGLPTSLVCESVGAEDPYQVPLRPYRTLRKLPVFFRLLQDQLTVVGRTRRWVRDMQNRLPQRKAERKEIWQTQASEAFASVYQDARQVYVELVSLMQALTAAMSGPVKLLDKLGWLSKLTARSKSSEYLLAYQQLLAGQIPREEFLSLYGHRGFYESDLGQARFAELPDSYWESQKASSGPAPKHAGKGALLRFLFSPIVKLIHSREWLRHESMRFFQEIREELKLQTQETLGEEVDFARFFPEDLQEQLQHPAPLPNYPQASGWDMDTFLRNRNDRRLALSVLSNVRRSPDEKPVGLGIYPGKVRGQVWKVKAEEMSQQKQAPFPQAILLTDSLDPGWVPYFVQVKGVLSYVGGLLSHASIILRESRIPSITQLPRQLELQNGDWIEMDGKTGEVAVVNRKM